MMKHLLLFAAILIGGLSVNAMAKANCEVMISQTFSYATSDMQQNGVAFFAIHNNGNHDDRLIGVSSDVAERTEMHTHTMDGDMMQMREVDGYDVPAGGTVEFAPTGHHIMLIGLKEKLVMGDSFPLTLAFKESGERKINVDIIPPGTKPAHKEPHEHH